MASREWWQISYLIETVNGHGLLLHDGSSAKDAAGRPVVLTALPLVLEALARQSLRATSLPGAS